MTEPDGALVVRTVTIDNADAYLELDQWAFAFDHTELDVEPVKQMIPWGRAFGAYLGNDLAGIYACFTFDMTVPGGAQGGLSTACGGLTWVAVHPQYRRRGVLTTMMRHHLQEVRDRGESVSALFAAEPAIYGRFGYGLAAKALTFTLNRGVALREVPGSESVRVRFEKADMAKHSALVERCRDGVRATRPGEMSRPGEGLQREAFADQRPWRRGAETLRIAIAEDASTGEVRGYALFRRKSEWADTGPNGQVTVREFTAADPAAARALWGRLTDLDLMAKVMTDGRPVDDPLVSMLVDIRAASARLSDNLWVRIVSVPQALAARRYACDVDVVLEVHDDWLPDNSGRWRLRGGPDDDATCEATDRPADLAIDVRELGAALLGGTTLTGLASAGQVCAGSTQALWTASRAFSSPVAPICGYMF